VGYYISNLNPNLFSIVQCYMAAHIVTCWHQILIAPMLFRYAYGL